jgi:hydroxypyruvate reductase
LYLPNVFGDHETPSRRFHQKTWLIRLNLQDVPLFFEKIPKILEFRRRMDTSTFFTHSQQDPRVARILTAALAAVDPEEAVRRYLQARPLPPARRVFVFGLGKASIPMTRAISSLIHLTDALVITKHADTSDSLRANLETVTVIEGGHPIPNIYSLEAGQAALEFVAPLTADDLLICLISGGGSALMTSPQPGVTLDDMQSLTRSLLACGAWIDEINTLRRHLDRVKGGGLATATQARVLSLVLSDVVGNPLEAIASGPTSPDPTTQADAIQVLRKYKLTGSVPSAILRALEDAPETPKTGDALFARVENIIVGSNALAAQAALNQAKAEGFSIDFLGDDWQGEARETAVLLCERLKQNSAVQAGALCLVAGGETTVTLRGEGKGGRNQELALAAVSELAGLENIMLITLATDGEDGPTDAAGAVVTGQTQQRARSMGLDAAQYLSGNDSHPFFSSLNDALKIGSTGTNVNDLTFLFRL